MTIRTRFTLALAVVGVVLFGTYAVVEYRNERDDLRSAAVREIRIIGRSLQTSLGNALRDRQGADIEETLVALEALEPNVDIHLHGVDGQPIAHSRGAILDGAIEWLASSPIETVAFYPEEDPQYLVYSGPVTNDDGGPLGTVGIVRPIDDLHADLERTRNRTLWVVVIFLIGTVATGMLLGTLQVTRPIKVLLAAMKQARRGDFRSRVAPPRRRDEIGELVDEFNAMTSALAAARARMEAETETRERLEQGLRRIDKLVTIGQLSAGLAHEIGSPLQVLSGRASALSDHEDPEVRRQSELLVAECERIARVVEQLLSFGRRRPAVVAPCDLATPVRTVIDLVGGEARRRGVDLVSEIAPGHHRIAADADQMQQIALNLISNALAATPRGGRIVVRIDRAGPVVRLSVRDNGPGISKEMQERLFEPFFTTRASEGGSGLGLAVVRSIADEHKAKVDIISESGGGAEFIVSFPRLEEPRRG